MKLREPIQLPTTTFWPQCSLCGEQGRAVSIYFSAAAKAKVAKGFYTDLAQKLCYACVKKMLALFGGEPVMEGPQLKVMLTDLRETLSDDDALKAILYKELGELATRNRLKPELVIPLLEDAFTKVREQTRKFRSDPDDPFPPPNVNCLAVQITLPVAGKVGVTEMTAKVIV